MPSGAVLGTFESGQLGFQHLSSLWYDKRLTMQIISMGSRWMRWARRSINRPVYREDFARSHCELIVILISR